MDSQGARRVHLLARLGLFWAVCIVARLFQLQIFQHDKYLSLAQQQQERVVEIQAPRGAILDRSGQPLALSLPVDSVCVNPLRVEDPAMASDILSQILGIDRRLLFAKMKMAAADHRGFLWVKRKITPEESKRLRDLRLEWIEFRTESRRFYPNREMAAHVLGGVDFEEKGNAGVELAFNDDLEGHAGSVRVTSDVKQRGFDSQVDAAPQPGKTLKLTIDSRIQYIAERQLARAVKEHHCKTGSLVAMDPKTGDILALANYPAYDPNETPKPGDNPEARDNLAVTTPFEPGSVFKVITIASALETTRLRPETVIPCGNGSITLFGRTVHDHNSYASLPMEDVLARSSNIGAINVGLKVGNKNLYEYIRRFGFGKATGLPLPGESAGELHALKYWQKTSIGSVAMGHEIGVTSLQLAQACSVIANGGFLIRPRLLTDAPKAAPRRVLKPETAITMRRMMEGVIIKPYGTGHKYARIAGYTSGGKTGTAQIYDRKARQYTHLYNASFMGFAPVTNPAIVVVVTVNGTTGTAGYGGPVSAPVFRDVAAAALRMTDVPKDLPDEAAADGDAKADENDVAIAELAAPEAALPLQQEAAVAFAAEGPVTLAGPKVPDFHGKSIREAIQLSAAQGIPLEYMGSGVGRAQFPPPGAMLPAGERVRIQFGR